MFSEDISTGDRDVGCLEKILAQVTGKISRVFRKDISIGDRDVGCLEKILAQVTGMWGV